ncbi:B3/4 domain-containing protein [Cytobacillus sp. FJAT-54145]|uniref:B3/4 domain-containing protein n=1 Tax=Cytobacillus spartinae TaxID=3299023 RepID=A0ABW6KIH4_9BACI
MEIIISSELKALVPDFKVGVIKYQNIEVGPSPQMLKGRLQLFQESLFFELEEKNVAELEGIKEWRGIFKKTGKDPNRYRHSAEAMYRRVKKQSFLQTVNSATDMNNFLSLQYQIPLGIYDTDKLTDSVTIRTGEDGEEYLGLNGRVNSLHNLILSADKEGPFGSPFVDSERTAVTEETKNALHIIYLRPSISRNDASELVESIMKMFVQIHGGDSSFEIKGCL